MKVESIQIDKIDKDDKYFLSYSLSSTKCEELVGKFPYTYFVLIDNDNRIIYGFEFLEYFKRENIERIDVVRTDISEKDAIVAAYNYKLKFFGFNTFEKLIFICKALSYFTVSELYQNLEIDISINEELKSKIDLLCTDEFKTHLVSERINLKAALSLCRWKKKDRSIVIDLFSKISFSKSQQLNIVEMFEELIFKEKSDLKTIYDKLNIDKLFKEEKPQRIIIDKIFSCRYPAYKKESDLWNKKIKNLKPPSNVAISHFPFFEKKNIELKINIKKKEHIEKIIHFLKTL